MKNDVYLRGTCIDIFLMERSDFDTKRPEVKVSITKYSVMHKKTDKSISKNCINEKFRKQLHPCVLWDIYIEEVFSACFCDSLSRLKFESGLS